MTVNQFFEDIAATMTPDQRLEAAKTLLKDLPYVILSTAPEERKGKGSKLGRVA